MLRAQKCESLPECQRRLQLPFKCVATVCAHIMHTHTHTQWRWRTNNDDDGNHSHNVHLDDAEKVLNAVRNGHRQLVHAETMQIVADDEQLGERVHRTKADHTAPVHQIGEPGAGAGGRLSAAGAGGVRCVRI